MKTGFVYHPDYLKHQYTYRHVECPQRLRAIVDRLKSTGLSEALHPIDPTPVEKRWLSRVHDPDYIDEVKNTALHKAFFFDSDTYANHFSYEVAKLAAGGVLNAVDAVMAGEVDNVFCAVRPPGHHAERHQAMGFCLFGNVAVAARYLQHQYHLERILIIDWDVHHGNGTQHIFEDDPSVFFVSIHEYPLYPGTGAASEVGIGAGKGFTLNIPVPAFSGDEVYRRAFSEKIVPVTETFQPEFILISAGFDAHQADPLAHINLTTPFFGEMTRIVKQLAADLCQNRLISVLEGGYDVHALADCVQVHLETLMD